MTVNFDGFISSLDDENESKCLLGEDYVPIMQEAMNQLSSIWKDERAKALASFKFEEDKAKITEWFLDLFDQKSGPPEEANTLMLWFVGSGPYYPIAVSAYLEKVKIEEDDDWFDTEKLGHHIWGWGDDLGFCYPPFASKTSEALIKDDPEAEVYALNDLQVSIINFYARLLVSWLSVRFKDKWLKHQNELIVVYGITGNDEGHVAGRLSVSDGWQPVGDLSN